LFRNLKNKIRCKFCGHELDVDEVYSNFDRRHPVICNTCGKEMVFAKDIMKSNHSGSIYLKYVCPSREGERGCGSVKMVKFSREPNTRYVREEHNSFSRS
jgi:transcription elongation factor Elf1